MSKTAAAFEGFPFVIGWEFTVACNLRCRHCGSSAGLPREGELTTDEALRLCDQLPPLLVQEVDFTGGEPLLRPDWPIVASKLVDLGIAANILTNGLRVDGSIIAKMQDVGISGVGISLDGLEETHDYVRNHSGSFNSVLRSIRLMTEAGLPFNVITTVNSRNLSELPGMLDLLLAEDVRFWRLQPVIPMGRMRDHAHLTLAPRGMIELGRFIQAARARIDKNDLYIICSDGLEYVVEDDPEERPWRGCPAGIVACGITSDGKVKGCLSMPDDLIEGDVRQSSLWDIWFDSNSFAYTRKFQEAQLGENCRDCVHGLECKGGCSASSYCSTGRFHNDPSCFFKASLDQAPALSGTIA